MAEFTFTSPEGKKYVVTGPEGATQEQAWGILQGQLAAAPKAEAAPAEKPAFDAADVAKSGGVGLVKGGIGLAGMLGDVGELGAKGIDAATQYVGEKLGLDPASLKRPGTAQTLSGMVKGEEPKRQTILSELPGSDAIRKKVEAITGPLYEPKTTAGDYAQTIGEFAPAAFGGPGSWLARGARMAVPAIASETAGQATKGTVLEPVARIAAGIGAGNATALLSNARTASAARAGAARAGADEVRDAARQNYTAARSSGVEINPHPVSAVASRIETALTDLGLTERNVPETYGVIRTLQNPPPGAVMRAQDFENARQELVQARQSVTNRREAVAANHAIAEIDHYLANIPAADVLRGNVDVFRRNIGEARANWAAASRADQIAGKYELGDLNAATAHSGQNIDNATRQAVKQLIRPDKNGRTQAQKSGFDAEEIALMNRVARGTTTGNTARFIGKLAPTNLMAMAMHGGAAGASGGSTLPLSAASYVAKLIGDASTSRSANTLLAQVLSRAPHVGPAPNPQLISHSRSALANALLGAQSSQTPLSFAIPAQFAQ